MRILFLIMAVTISNLSKAEPLRIVTTIAPITDLVTRIGGHQIEVSGLIPEGFNSHTFEPAPSHIRTLAAADLIITNGLNLEAPIIKLATQVKRTNTAILKLGNQTLDPTQLRFDFSFPRDKGHPNPHLWPNVRLTMRYVELIRDALVEREPAGRLVFQQNSTLLLSQLGKLDRTIFACVDSIPKGNRRLVTYHDSFAYFAPRYGMEVIGAIQPSDFAQPSAREVARIITQLRALGLPAIFGSRVFSSPVLAQIAKESKTRFVDQLRDDDLPGKSGEANHSYIGMMRSNIRIITEALGGNIACLQQSSVADQ